MKLWMAPGTRRATAIMLLAFAGCVNRHDRTFYNSANIPPPPAKPGYSVENMFRREEDNAEATDFILNEHDFEDRESVRLNDQGKLHLKNMAARMRSGARFPIIIERSQYSLDERANEEDFNYPIHPNPELDNKRREAIAQVLTYLGVPQADCRVLVSVSPTPHLEGRQAIQNYGTFANDVNRAGNLGFYGPQAFGFGLGGFGGIF